jgi:hypothetical protein
MEKKKEKFFDPRVPTPEDDRPKKKYPHLSDSVENLLTGYKEVTKEKFVPLDYSKFKYAKNNKKVNHYRLSNFKLAKPKQLSKVTGYEIMQREAKDEVFDLNKEV